MDIGIILYMSDFDEMRSNFIQQEQVPSSFLPARASDYRIEITTKNSLEVRSWIVALMFPHLQS